MKSDYYRIFYIRNRGFEFFLVQVRESQGWGSSMLRLYRKHSLECSAVHIRQQRAPNIIKHWGYLLAATSQFWMCPSCFKNPRGKIKYKVEPVIRFKHQWSSRIARYMSTSVIFASHLCRLGSYSIYHSNKVPKGEDPTLLGQPMERTQCTIRVIIEFNTLSRFFFQRVDLRKTTDFQESYTFWG